jgi:DeoR/GlpR family transcriptional regulator of sugar metabolism
MAKTTLDDHQTGSRIQQVAQAVLARGSASAQDLAAEFGVSLMTIHRDLDKLEAQGVLRKYRGGVSAQPSGIFESNIAYRRTAMQAAKAAIAEYAASFVEPGMSVMLDDSTSVQAMLPFVMESTPIHVVTNFLDGMNELAGAPGVELLALGGDYDDQHRSFLGVACVEAIRALRVDAAFVSISAVSDGLAFHQEQRIVSVKREMLDVATTKYLLLDHTKIGKTALHRVAALTDFDLVIVDREIQPSTLADFERLGVNYAVAPAAGSKGTASDNA